VTTVLEHVYRPYGTCRDLWLDKGPEILLSGPAGTGKSRSCLEKLQACMLKYPRSRGVIVRKVAASIGGSALDTYRKHVASELIAAGQVRYYGGSASEPPQYRYSNGSVILIVGMDKASKIMSTEFDMIYIQEATELTEDDWESLSTRLRNGRMPYQQIIADANPNVPYHWLNQRCQRGQCRMVNTQHTDNPVLYQDGVLTPAGEAYMLKLEALSGVRKARLLKGLWQAAEGLVYELYDPAVHLIDKFTPPKAWKRYWVIDFGFSNPFVLQFWAEDPDGRLYLYREIYKTKVLVEDHAKHAIKLVTDAKGQWTEPRPFQVIADPADAEGRQTFTKHSGLPTVEAKKGKKDGIQVAQKRFETQEDGKPRIFIMRGCTVEIDSTLEDAKKPYSTEQEIVGYVWPEDKTGDKAEEPVKEDDHGMDCMRYMVAQRDLRGSYDILSF
jgi:phage terminase large subunit